MENYALLAFKHAPTPIVVLSYRRIKALNDAFANLFGYAHDELLNQSMQKLFPSVEDFEKIGKEALTVWDYRPICITAMSALCVTKQGKYSGQPPTDAP